jgi:hypothetical protein
MINNSNKKIVSNIVSGLLFGNFIVLTAPTQASIQHSRGSRVPQIGRNIPQPRRNIQENRERENEPGGLTKEEAAKLLSGDPGTVKKFIKSQKKRRESNKRIQLYQERLRQKKA